MRELPRASRFRARLGGAGPAWLAPLEARWARWAPVWLGLACGPSFEVLQEGDLRFAHCERLDLDGDIALSHRLHCWREWRRVYTYGQTRDRAEYSQRRIAELVSGDSSPPFELPVAPPAMSVAGALRQPLVASPVGRRGPPARGASCQAECRASLVRCSEGCEVRATGCEPCRLDHARCVQGCA